MAVNVCVLDDTITTHTALCENGAMVSGGMSVYVLATRLHEAETFVIESTNV